MPKYNVIGKPLRRVDGRAKVTGLTKFADDLAMPGMLFMKLLRSTVPHARIRHVDASHAEKIPGVKLVLTGKDFPIPFGILPVSQDEHALCTDKVRFIGDPVAAVIATDELTAFEALDHIHVQYEKLTTIADPADALSIPEPRLHDHGDEGNVHKKVALDFGDVDAGLASSDHVFEDVFFFEGNTHLAIEQHATLAYLDPDGKLVVASSTQTPHYLHRALAKVLEIPPAHIRVIATPNGGGFGGKSDPFNHEIVAARAAMYTGKPVKIALTREEVFYCHRGRHPVLMKLKTGVQNDGKIVAQELQTLLDGGAYGSYGVASTFYTGALQTVTYQIPRYRFRGCRVFTCKPPCGPKRGHGTPQPRFGLEVQIDKICEKLGLDPAQWRIDNAVPPDSLTANWLRINSMGMVKCIQAVVEGSRWNERFRKLGPGRGLGLACSSYLCGAGLPIYWNKLPHSGVQLKLDRSGGVTAFCGATEIGQGSDNVLVACIAEAVSEKLKLPRVRLVFADRRVFDAENPQVGVKFAEAVQLAEAKFGTLGTVGSYSPPAEPGQFKGAGVGPSPAYSYSAAVVEVEVDPATGWLRVPKIWIAHDIGISINPVLARGQVEGSVYMGLGEALMEEQAYRRLPKKLSDANVHKFPSLLEYKSPGTMDMPEIETYLIEEPDKNGPFGAKEVGQGPLLPIMPAVANAVYDAVRVRVDEIPVTPEKILKALKDKARRFGPKAFPTIAWPEPLVVPPPWEGGDGKAINEKPRKRDQVAGIPVAPPVDTLKGGPQS